MQEATARIRYSVIQYEPTEPGRLRYLLKFSGESVIAMLTIIIIIIIIFTVMLPRMILHPAGGESVIDMLTIIIIIMITVMLPRMILRPAGGESVIDRLTIIIIIITVMLPRMILHPAGGESVILQQSPGIFCPRSHTCSLIF